MLNFFRNSTKLNTFITIIVALLTINLSIDTDDSFYSKTSFNNNIKDNLEINDIESLYELITEVLLGIDNHLEEGDEFEYEELIKKIHLLFFQKIIISEFEVPSFVQTKLINKQLYIEIAITERARLSDFRFLGIKKVYHFFPNIAYYGIF